MWNNFVECISSGNFWAGVAGGLLAISFMSLAVVVLALRRVHFEPSPDQPVAVPKISHSLHDEILEILQQVAAGPPPTVLVKMRARRVMEACGYTLTRGSCSNGGCVRPRFVRNDAQYREAAVSTSDRGN